MATSEAGTLVRLRTKDGYMYPVAMTVWLDDKNIDNGLTIESRSWMPPVESHGLYMDKVNKYTDNPVTRRIAVGTEQEMERLRMKLLVEKYEKNGWQL